MEDLEDFVGQIEDLEEATADNNISRQLTRMRNTKYHAQHTN